MSVRAALPRLVTLVPALTLALPAPAPAQQTASAPAPLVALTLDQAVQQAIEHNPDLAVARYDAPIGDTRVAQALGAFTPSVTTSTLLTGQTQPPSSFFVGQQGIESDLVSASLGVSQRLPWFGSSYSVAWDGNRQTTASPFTNFNPSLGSRIRLVFSQPLLRDRLIDTAREQLARSRTDRDVADVAYRERLVQTTAAVKRAYWDYVGARAAVDVARRSLDLARDLERNNRIRVEVGDLPPLDLVAAQAEVAQREEERILAEAAVRRTEDVLRALVLDPSRDDFWQVRLEPSDPLPDVASLPDVDLAVRQAFADRTDLVRARAELENARLAVSLRDNQRLPDLRLQASLATDGVGGSRLLYGTDGFPPPIIGREATGFGTVLGQVITGDFPTWSLGLTLSYPIGRSFEEADLARARLEADRTAARIRSLEVEAARQVRGAALDMEAGAKRIESTRVARELAERRLDSEQKRFEVGMSTSFLVVQAQRDLAQARINEVLAHLAYERARIDFEALRQAGPAGAGATAGPVINLSAPPAAATTGSTGPGGQR